MGNCFDAPPPQPDTIKIGPKESEDDGVEHLFKVVIIGDSGVGKSTLIVRYAEGTYTDTYTSTIGVDFKLKPLEVDGRKCKIQLWDTAGQERFRTITNSFLRGAAAMIVTFDVTNQESLNNVSKWKEEIDKNGNDNVVKWLIGNKCDLPRVVSEADAREVAQRYGMEYSETSSKTGINVDETFFSITREMLTRKRD